MESLAIENFIKFYPRYDEPASSELVYGAGFDAANVVPNKLEFAKRLEPAERQPDEPGVPLDHQRFFARFASAHTPYDEVLAFDAMGTGKTCSAVMAAEEIMRGERGKSPRGIERVLVLVKGDQIAANMRQQIAFRCTKGRYVPKGYDVLPETKRVPRLNRLIGERYDIQTFITFAKRLRQMADEMVARTYSDHVIIVDEVHNAIIRQSESDVEVYKQLHRLLHLARNRKVILLSGTPMRDTPEEFPLLMNLMLPLERQMPTDQAFLDRFFDAQNRLINKEELGAFVRGRVSFLQGMRAGVDVRYVGRSVGLNTRAAADPQTNNFAITRMHAYQARIYLPLYSKTAEAEAAAGGGGGGGGPLSSLYIEALNASLMVFPDDKFGREGFARFVRKRPGAGGAFALDAAFARELRGVDGRPATVLSNIKKYSSKYHAILASILANRDRNTFVYNRYVRGSGAIVFCLLLELLGYANAKYERDPLAAPAPRYALVTGETASAADVARLVDGAFNDPKNKHGAYVQVVVGSRIISEGKSLRNVRAVHIATPHWNNAEIDQAVARGIRAFSHEDLPPEERFVAVYRHVAAVRGAQDSVDFMLYKRAFDKDFMISQIARVCKEWAVNCVMNRARNFDPAAADGTRACNYEACAYDCAGWSGRVAPIRDTYTLFADRSAADEFVRYVRVKFMKRFAYTAAQLHADVADLISVDEFYMMLYDMVDSNVPVPGAYGFDCYLRESGGVFFLVDDLKVSADGDAVFYAAHPNFTDAHALEDWLVETEARFADNPNVVAALAAAAAQEEEEAAAAPSRRGRKRPRAREEEEQKREEEEEDQPPAPRDLHEECTKYGYEPMVVGGRFKLKKIETDPEVLARARTDKRRARSGKICESYGNEELRDLVAAMGGSPAGKKRRELCAYVRAHFEKFDCIA